MTERLKELYNTLHSDEDVSFTALLDLGGEAIGRHVSSAMIYTLDFLCDDFIEKYRNDQEILEDYLP